jgi:uncharacterized protein YcaQ
MTTYPLAALRALALRTQGLHNPIGSTPPPGREVIYKTIHQIGCVQIDTLQVVARSQYLALWSRLGSYNPEDFDALASGPERCLFEGWQHAACLIPLEEYRYQIPHQKSVKEKSSGSGGWAGDPDNAELARIVYDRIRKEGALRVSDFEGDGRPRGSWWDWKPAKQALEHLYAWGELMIDGRVNFQRRYDLTGRILPGWIDQREPTPEERDRFWVERAARALGVCTPRQAGDYTWMKVTKARPQVEALVKEGRLVPIQGEISNGKTAELLVHRDNLSLLEQAAGGALKAERTTFLSPFDSLWWAGRRDEMLWGFRKSLEAYLPEHKRVYGYFCLPILHNDRLVGRFDPKLERRQGCLRLKKLYLEPGLRADEQLVADVAAAMRDFMAFHGAKDLVVEESHPKVFGKKLSAQIIG